MRKPGDAMRLVSIQNRQAKLNPAHWGRLSVTEAHHAMRL